MSDYYRKSVSAMYGDGKVRRVRARAHTYDGSLACDTFFSAPAAVTVSGKYIHGYVTGLDPLDYPADKRASLPEYEFRAHTVCDPWIGGNYGKGE